jgi:hypothetical protein
MSDLALELDTWLRTQRRWVSAREIEDRFHISQRKLRFDGGEPGLLSYTCISSTKPGFSGFKHVRVASDEEFAEADRKDREALRARFIVLKRRRQARRAEKTLIPSPMEAKTGQCLLFA